MEAFPAGSGDMDLQHNIIEKLPYILLKKINYH